MREKITNLVNYREIFFLSYFINFPTCIDKVKLIYFVFNISLNIISKMFKTFRGNHKDYIKKSLIFSIHLIVLNTNRFVSPIISTYALILNACYFFYYFSNTELYDTLKIFFLHRKQANMIKSLVSQKK